MQRIGKKFVALRKVDVGRGIFLVVHGDDKHMVLRNGTCATVGLWDAGRRRRITHTRHNPVDIGMGQVIGREARRQLADPQLRHHFVHEALWTLTGGRRDRENRAANSHAAQAYGAGRDTWHGSADATQKGRVHEARSIQCTRIGTRVILNCLGLCSRTGVKTCRGLLGSAYGRPAAMVRAAAYAAHVARLPTTHTISVDDELFFGVTSDYRVWRLHLGSGRYREQEDGQ